MQDIEWGAKVFKRGDYFFMGGAVPWGEEMDREKGRLFGKINRKKRKQAFLTERGKKPADNHQVHNSIYIAKKERRKVPLGCGKRAMLG